jgi:hypothetical protein
MAKKQNPRELLNDVLNLISKDVEEIEKLSTAGKLDGEVAATLVKYSDALLKMVKDNDGQEEAEKAKLANMSTDELAEKARHYMDRLKKK